MRISVLSIVIILYFGVFSIGQQPVVIQPDTERMGQVRADCPDMHAGNARIISTTDGETLIDVDDVVLCADRGVLIGHDGDYQLGQDPDDSTPAGVWYAVFTDEPTTSGVIDESTLASLDHIVQLDNGNLIFARADDENGNMIIINDGSFLEAAGLMAPIQLWFAPITIHNTEGNTPEEFFENSDACIHLNANSAFTITYLNELNFTNSNPAATTGSITVTGGMPEFNDSDYTVTLTNLRTNEVVQLDSDNGTDFNYVNLSEDNSYRLTISDNVECSSSRIINFRSGDPMVVDVPHLTANPGDQICIPLTVQDFNEIGTFSFAVGWNPSILEFESISYKNPILSQGGSSLSDNTDFSNQGVAIFTWITNDPSSAINIPNDSSLIELCFTAIGDPGEILDVTVGPHKGTGIEFTNLEDPINFTIDNGSVTIVPANILDFSYSICGSDNDYDLNVQIFGGRGPYQYQLNGPTNHNGDNSASQLTIQNLERGTYDLVITDAEGNEVTREILVGGAESNPEIASLPNNCSSGPNGIAYITNPPEGEYQIEWTYNNQKFYNVDTLRNLVGGEVSFRITDENNCPSPERTVIIPNNSIQATAEVLENPNCDGTPGTVRIQISGGTTPYTIFTRGNTISAPATIELEIYRESESFNIQDDNGCAINLDVTSTVTGGESFTLEDSTVVDINCENDTTATGTGWLGQFSGTVVSSSGGGLTRANLYHGDGTPVHGTKMMVNTMTGQIRARFLDAGDYYWEIEGACAGASTQFTFAIQNLVANPPTINETVTAIGCGSENGHGAISLEVFPAKDNYIFEWSNGETAANIDELDAGEYTVTLTDPDTRCSVTGVYTINEGVTYSKIETTLPCDADTMAHVGVSIRDDYESIAWDNGGTTELIEVSMPGYYGFSITLTDPDCSPIRDSIYVSSATGGVEIDGINPVLIDDCGNPEGLFVVYLTEPIANYGFSWDNAPPEIGLNEFRVFDAGQHNLKIYQDDCVAIDTTISFVFNNIIEFDTASFNVSCFGDDDGEITVSATGGGSNNFRYEFERNGNPDLFGEYTNLAPGRYTVTVIDQTASAGSPCPAVDLTFDITEPDPFTVAVDTTQVLPPSCAGEWDGMLQLVLEGGNPGPKDIRYTYSGGAARTELLLLDSLRASNYQIRVEDSLNCVATTTYLLEDPDPIHFEIPDIAEPECAGYTTQVILASATGGTGMDFQYSVDGGVPVPLGEPLDILAGEHLITVYDGNLCNTSNAVIIPEPQPILVSFNQPDTILVSLGENIELSAEVNGENPINDYIWTPTPPDSLNTREILQFSAVQNVTINLDVVDSRGCIGSNEVFVLVRKTRDIGIPNAFTPNGDGHNDLLTVIPGPAVRSIQQFQIYDRYGTLVWEESDISPAQAQITGWDGTYDGNPAMVDVYVMLLRVEYIDGQVIQRVADVTLIK